MADETTSRRWKERFVNGLLALATLATCLAIAEMAVRAMVSGVDLLPRFHTVAQYGDYSLRRLRPETTFYHTTEDGSWRFVTNRQGFRSETDYSYDKPAGACRVLALGDSQTQGFEVRQDYTFAKALERILAAGSRRAEVYNTGISGFGTAEQLVFLEQEGLRYHPDAVVLGFYANDFDDTVKSNLFALEDGRLVLRSKAHAPGVAVLDALNAIWLPRWLSQNSYFYSFAMNTVWESAKAGLAAARRAKVQNEMALADPRAVDEYAQDLVAVLIEQMRAVTAAHRIKLVLVDIPALDVEHQFTSSIPPRVRARFQAASDAFIDSEALLGTFRHAAEIHVPHGQRHIAEFTHVMIASAVAKALSVGDPPCGLIRAERLRELGSTDRLSGG